MKTIRVLVVDDFQPFRQWMTTKLKATHHSFEVVGEAAEAADAVQKAGELKPDLILLDVSLAGANGIEAEIHICRVLPSAKILFVSGCADTDIAQCALTNGAKGYVIKSEAERELLPAIEAVLSGGTFVSKMLKLDNRDPLPLGHSIAIPALT